MPDEPKKKERMSRDACLEAKSESTIVYLLLFAMALALVGFLFFLNDIIQTPITDYVADWFRLVMIILSGLGTVVFLLLLLMNGKRCPKD